MIKQTTKLISAPENGAYTQINPEADEEREENNMANLHITAYPYATIDGDLDVPDEVVNGSDEKLHEYISDHWEEIEFGEVDLDFQGCDYEFD